MIFALRYWKVIAGGIVLIALLFMLHVRTNQRDAARNLARDTQSAFDKTVADYRTKAEIARRQDIENVARVQAEQATITQKVSNDYQVDLAAARARADALRVRLSASSGNSGVSGKPGVSEASNATSRPDATTPQNGLSVSERLIATEQAIQLAALQRWIVEQSTVEVKAKAPE